MMQYPVTLIAITLLGIGFADARGAKRVTLTRPTSWNLGIKFKVRLPDAKQGWKVQQGSSQQLSATFDGALFIINSEICTDFAACSKLNLDITLSGLKHRGDISQVKLVKRTKTSIEVDATGKGGVTRHGALVVTPKSGKRMLTCNWVAPPRHAQYAAVLKKACKSIKLLH